MIKLWPQQLTEADRRSLRHRHPDPNVYAYRSLLEDDHGPIGGGNSGDQSMVLSEQKLWKMVESGRPYALVRVGDADCAAVMGHYFPVAPPQRIEAYAAAAGYDYSEKFEAYRVELAEAYAKAPLLGVHNREAQSVWRANTGIMLHLLGVGDQAPRLVDVQLPYVMLTNGSLSRLVEGKRVLLVGALAGELCSALRSGRHLEWPFLGAWDAASYEVITTPRTKAYSAIEPVARRAIETAADLTLVSAGVAAKIITYRVWRAGLCALDVGYVFDALLGGSGRHRRLGMRQAPW